MKQSDTLGAQVKRAWGAPRGMKVPWLTQMTNSRKPALSREAEAQRKYDARSVAKMRKRIAHHNATVRKEACRA